MSEQPELEKDFYRFGRVIELMDHEIDLIEHGLYVLLEHSESLRGEIFELVTRFERLESRAKR